MKGLDYVGIAPGIAKDTKIALIATALRKDRYWVAGHFPAFFGEVAEHAPDGNLSSVPDDLLDDWAGGVRGWGALVRQHLCVDGQLEAWWKYNGRALENLERDRRRKSERRREDDGKSVEIPRNVPARSEDYTVTDTDTDTSPNGEENKHSARDLEAEFAEAWNAYPRRPGDPRTKALRAYTARRKAGVKHADILAGVQAYAAYVARECIEPRFVKMGATFFGPDEHWRTDFGPVKVASPGERVVALFQGKGAAA